MITELERNSLGGGRVVSKYIGLSTDTKPSYMEPFVILMNGSSFFEMDTGLTYWFDEERCAWIRPGEVEVVERPDFDNMTKAQLLEYADENCIEISKSAKKAEILDKIKE